MTNDFIEFYKTIIDSIGVIKYTDDGYLYVPEEDGRKSLININGKMLVLPTKENIESLVVKRDDGSLEVTKILFNPLKESVNRGNSVSLSRLKGWIEKKLSFDLACVGEMLLILASEPKMQKDTGLEINKFLSSITEAMNSNIKEIVDSTSREKWGSLYKKTFEKNTGFLTLFIHKLYKIEGEKYNRATILGSDVYTELLKASKDKPVLGVNLRNKDITVFKLLFEYLLEGLDKEHETIAIGSNDNECAAFISLLKTYIKVSNRLNKIADLVKFTNGEIYDAFYSEVKITVEDLDNIERFKSQYTLVPDEHEAERHNAASKAEAPAITKPQIQSSYNIPTMNVQTTPAQTTPVAPVAPVAQPVGPVTPPVQPTPVQQQPVPYNEPLQTTVRAQELQASGNSGAAAALQYLNNKNRVMGQLGFSSHGGLRGVNAVQYTQPQPQYGYPAQPTVGYPNVGYPAQAPMGYQAPQTQPQQMAQVGGFANPRRTYQPMERVQMQPYYPNQSMDLRVRPYHSTVDLRGVKTSFPR